MPTRRNFLAISGTAVILAPLTGFAQAKSEAEVSPTEDLMREHGVLRRILLIYEHFQQNPVDPKVLTSAADIIRSFIEDYHERLEEDFLFPRFEKADKLTELVKVLREQHQVGRRLTAEIRQFATPEPRRARNPGRNMATAMGAFVRLYRPHAAREDTVLFPALHQLVSAKEFDALGDQFEDKERALFGKDGFERMVARVAELERQLGMYDLEQYSRAAPSPKPEKQ